MREYDNRFFYLMMDETDIVTGRHLKKIPKAVEEICESLEKKPSVVMICITCVDALLGTDMERVCRKAEERAGLPVRPCYMYALTQRGAKTADGACTAVIIFSSRTGKEKGKCC